MNKFTVRAASLTAGLMLAATPFALAGNGTSTATAAIDTRVPVVLTDHGVAARPSAISAWASETTVPVGGKFTFSGKTANKIKVVKFKKTKKGRKKVTVRKSVRRVVQLQEDVNGQWVVRGTFKTSKSGSFSFPITVGTRVGQVPIRASVARKKVGKKRLRAGVTYPITITVVDPNPTPTPQPSATPTPTPQPSPTPTVPTDGYDAPIPPETHYVPTGSTSDWSNIFTPQAGRWNPCQIIEWTYHPAGETYPALNDAKRSVGLISGRTGLKFKYVPPGSAGIDLNMRWGNATSNPELAGSVAGYGTAYGYSVPNADVQYRIERGELVLDNESVLGTGFTNPYGSAWGQIITHEVLHTLGLGHATGQDQLMYGVALTSNQRFGAGDITGMTAIGASKGCL